MGAASRTTFACIEPRQKTRPGDVGHVLRNVPRLVPQGAVCRVLQERLAGHGKATDDIKTRTHVVVMFGREQVPEAGKLADPTLQIYRLAWQMALHGWVPVRLAPGRGMDGGR